MVVVDDAPIRAPAEALLGERCAESVAAELLERVAVVCRYDASCVQREARDLGAERRVEGCVIEQLEAELGERRLDGLGEGISDGGSRALERGIGVAGVGGASLDDRDESLGDLAGQVFDVGCGRLGQGHEGERLVARRAGHEEPVGQQAVDVRIEIERTAEALHEASTYNCAR